MTALQRVATAITLVGSLALGPFLSAGAQTQERFLYLRGAAYPTSLLSSEPPLSETIKNLDRPRNDDPGLTLESGGVGRREFDDARYQDFLTEVGGATIAGTVTLTLWIAPAGLTAGPTSDLRALVADCNGFGFGCEELASGSASVAWTEPIGFVPVTVAISLDSHTFPADRVLKLRITTETSDGSPLWVAYDALETPSSLTIESYSTPTTTVTSTTVTPTTTQPTVPPTTRVTTTPTVTPSTNPATDPATSSVTTDETSPTTSQGPPATDQVGPGSGSGTTATTAPAATVTSGGRAAVALDPLVFDLSYGASSPETRGNPLISATSLIGLARSTLLRTWPWTLALLGLVGVVLWRDRHEADQL